MTDTDTNSNDTDDRFSHIDTGTERLEIIFGDDTELERLQRFKSGENRLHVKGDPITPATAATLIDGGYVDPEDRQNDAPTAQSLVDTAREYENRTPPSVDAQLAGYVVPASRSDARITFDEIRLESDSGDIGDDIQTEFLGEFDGRNRPDDSRQDTTVCYAWWD